MGRDFKLTLAQKTLKYSLLYAGIAQLVERNLAKVEVASSSLVSRSIVLGEKALAVSPFLFYKHPLFGGVAEWSCSGLQSRLRRFDSDPRLQIPKPHRVTKCK